MFIDHLTAPGNYQNLFIAKLPQSVTDDELMTVFAQHSPRSATVMLDAVTGRSKGYAFVLLPTQEAGRGAADHLDHSTITLHRPDGDFTFELTIFPSKHTGKEVAAENECLYIRNIPNTWPMARVEAFIAEHGKPVYSAVRSDHLGSPVWVVFVEYDSVESARRTLKAVHGAVVAPRCPPLLAKYAENEEVKKVRRERKTGRSAKAASARSSSSSVAASSAAAAAPSSAATDGLGDASGKEEVALMSASSNTNLALSSPLSECPPALPSGSAKEGRVGAKASSSSSSSSRRIDAAHQMHNIVHCTRYNTTADGTDAAHSSSPSSATSIGNNTASGKRKAISLASPSYMYPHPQSADDAFSSSSLALVDPLRAAAFASASVSASAAALLHSTSSISATAPMPVSASPCQMAFAKPCNAHTNNNNNNNTFCDENSLVYFHQPSKAVGRDVQNQHHHHHLDASASAHPATLSSLPDSLHYISSDHSDNCCGGSSCGSHCGDAASPFFPSTSSSRRYRHNPYSCQDTIVLLS